MVYTKRNSFLIQASLKVSGTIGPSNIGYWLKDNCNSQLVEVGSKYLEEDKDIEGEKGVDAESYMDIDLPPPSTGINWNLKL